MGEYVLCGTADIVNPVSIIADSHVEHWTCWNVHASKSSLKDIGRMECSMFQKVI